jgi:hypothetical protein
MRQQNQQQPQPLNSIQPLNSMSMATPPQPIAQFSHAPTTMMPAQPQQIQMPTQQQMNQQIHPNMLSNMQIRNDVEQYTSMAVQNQLLEQQNFQNQQQQLHQSSIPNPNLMSNPYSSEMQQQQHAHVFTTTMAPTNDSTKFAIIKSC